MMQAVSRLWLPFTQMQSFDSAERTFVRANGTSLIDARGRRVFDAVSSIWTIVHGHCHPAIVDAIALQASTLDHATTLGASNLPAETLASALCEYCETDYAFFGSDGASAVEAAIKMALQYWRNAGEPHRTRFLRLVDAYHGDTTGAMSLSDIAVFKSNYGAITFETRAYDDPRDLDAPDVAAIIVEPLVQAAAGMRLVSPGHYAPLRACTPLVIVDEIATGFGRTGTMFAFEQLELRPDLICLGQGYHGRCVGALGRARARLHLRCFSRRTRGAQAVLSRALVRRQPDRVCGGARFTRAVRARSNVRARRRHRSDGARARHGAAGACGESQRFAKSER